MLYDSFKKIIIVLLFFDFLLFYIDLGFISLTLFRVMLFLFIFLVIIRNLRIGLNYNYSNFEKYCMLVFLTWLTWSLGQIPFSINSNEALSGVSILIFYLILLLAINYRASLKNTNSILILMTWIYLIMIVIGYVEMLFDIHFSKSKVIVENLYMNAATGVFYNQNDYSLFLIIFLPIALYNVSKNIFKFVLIALTLYLILFNEAYLALAAIIIQITLLIINYKMDLRIKILYVASTVLVTIPQIPKIVDFYKDFYYEIKFQYGSGHIRLILIENTLDIIVNMSKFMGVGLNNIGIALGTYNNTTFVDPHNWWLELLATSGGIVFVLFTTLISFLLYKFYQNRNNKISYYFMLSLLAFVIGSMSPSSLFNMPFIWLYYALIILAYRVYIQNQKKDNSSLDES